MRGSTWSRGTESTALGSAVAKERTSPGGDPRRIPCSISSKDSTSPPTLYATPVWPEKKAARRVASAGKPTVAAP
eukprot:scaffold21255_cov62-Isochrysis_galbana.AAC.1